MPWLHQRDWAQEELVRLKEKGTKLSRTYQEGPVSPKQLNHDSVLCDCIHGQRTYFGSKKTLLNGWIHLLIQVYPFWLAMQPLFTILHALLNLSQSHLQFTSAGYCVSENAKSNNGPKKTKRSHSYLNAKNVISTELTTLVKVSLKRKVSKEQMCLWYGIH